MTMGETIPDFTLTGAKGTEIREFTLSSVAGDRPALLVFYIYDYSPVCETQICEINDSEWLMFNDDVTVLGISTDGPYSHRQFIADEDITYPLLSDGDLTVYEACGMTEDGADGAPEPKRGLVIVDGSRTVRYRWQPDDNWDAWDTAKMRETYDVLAALSSA
ncbi:peroxiredoxin [Haloglomus irregulare]|jgi:peroxiredoxin|uniref:thioredoxin-dependent peroxiredoxin n=1 Tax=Haloglomus irregulare TaxID=2234134 RepID=A0A554NCU8_9EURY|nr:redoxin domain-containing protein [Haloglomus irregulare]TSD14850.1 peroxiredoxin [Haloglomus irregulare]